MHVLNQGCPPPLPPVLAGHHLLSAWVEMGRCSRVPGAGITPLSFSEISSACPWADESERWVIRRMSDAYISGVQIGEDVLGIEPWEPDS